MSYAPVFESLQELFPQVDKRILKAASIEHAYNIDDAVEFILQEVIPSIPETVQSSETGVDNSNFYEALPKGLNPRTEVASSSTVSSILSSIHPDATFQNGKNVLHSNESDLTDSQNLYHSIVNTTLPKGNLLNNPMHVNEGISLSSSSKGRNWDLSVLIANNRASSQEKDVAIYHSDQNRKNGGYKVELTGDEADRPNGLNDQPVYEPGMSIQSTHSVNSEVLEDIVSDAKSSKMSMLASIEKLAVMVKNVLHLEDKASITKEEASTAGQGTFSKVEELREMLLRAKETNNLRAGEVYGEKSILSTEARELQSRLISLLDEKNRFQELMEEIQRNLEERLAAAEDEIAQAEKDRIEREESAQRALKEQEEMMAAIVEESKKLQLEAEENTKLRDFLVDRGRIVDSLQGEIAVLCEDIARLKETVDQRLPMTKSILSTFSNLSSTSPSVSQNKSTASLQRDVTIADSDEKIIMTARETRNGDGSSSSNTSVDWALVDETWTGQESSVQCFTDS